MSGISFIALNVGNSRTQIGRFEQGELEQSVSMSNGDVPQIVQRVIEAHRMIDSGNRAPIVIASVADTVAAPIASALRDQLQAEVYRVGDDVPVPIGRQLDPETITGVDRLLNAAAAYATIRQACIVVDAGTAVTVDFVDGQGTFHGGAIFPGATMQLRALHEHTAALPDIEFGRPEDEAFGRSTTQAMLQGVFYGIRGAVWKLVERYAEEYGAYPQVIATGGDAAVLFEGDELINNIVPDLSLRGIGEVVKSALSAATDERDEER